MLFDCYDSIQIRRAALEILAQYESLCSPCPLW
jgi:hypothetical protein